MSWKQKQLLFWANRDFDISFEYKAGATMKQIGLKYGIGKQRVSQILHARGAAVRKRGRPVKTDFTKPGYQVIGHIGTISY